MLFRSVAGGATAAARIRRIDESAQIIIVEKGGYISYANCGLPYYIGDEIKERDILFVHSPQSFGKRYNIDVRVHNEALSIDSVNKTVSIKNESGEIYTETYDKLLLSPGSVAVKPDINGIETDGIFTLKTVEDTDKIKKFVRP